MTGPLTAAPVAPPDRFLRRVAIAAALAALAAALLPVTPAVAGPPPPGAIGTSADDGEGAPSAEPRVILYATSWCPWCRKTRALLDELGVAYADKDIEKSAEAAREHREKAGPGVGVPVLDIGGTIVQGYDPAKIRRLVAELQAERAETAR